jgi:multidrug efflux pump subunit AcrA (membrane-fusion protein)
MMNQRDIGSNGASLIRWVLITGIIATVALGVIILTQNPKKAEPAPVTATPAPVLAARGSIEPVARANIATLTGGVVRNLPVRVGQILDFGQTVAEISTPAQIEILQAPWRGTIIGLNARLGDTLMAGAVVASIADLVRYQVETNDVDEYIISQIQPGQTASVSVDALDGRKLQGSVDTVALDRQTSTAGVIHYPVVIRLLDSDPELRPGMAVRVVFSAR